MKTITYKDVAALNFDDWFTANDTREKYEEQIARHRAIREEWTALDVLRTDEISASSRIFIVLETNIIDEPVLHEFACRCAERALSRVGKPDERSVAAIEAKRKWLRGEISDKELDAALDAAHGAAWNAAGEVVWDLSRLAAWAAARTSACDAAWAAAEAAARCAWRSVATSEETYEATFAEKSDEMREEQLAEREWQIAELMRMLEEQE